MVKQLNTAGQFFFFYFWRGQIHQTAHSCWNQLFSLILTAGGMLVLYFGSRNGYHFCCGVGEKNPIWTRTSNPPLDSRLGSQEVQATFYISENWIKCVTAFKLHLIFNWNRQLHVGLLSSSFLPPLGSHYSSFRFLMTVWLNGSNVVQKLSCILPTLLLVWWTTEMSKMF